MSEPWSVEGAARELCGCSECAPPADPRHRFPEVLCEAHFFAKGIKAGLAHAAEVAKDNEDCHVCSCELWAGDTRPHCEDGCSVDDDGQEIDHEGYEATSTLIRALLEERR